MSHCARWVGPQATIVLIAILLNACMSGSEVPRVESAKSQPVASHGAGEILPQTPTPPLVDADGDPLPPKSFAKLRAEPTTTSKYETSWPGVHSPMSPQKGTGLRSTSMVGIWVRHSSKWERIPCFVILEASAWMLSFASIAFGGSLIAGSRERT